MKMLEIGVSLGSQRAETTLKLYTERLTLIREKERRDQAENERQQKKENAKKPTGTGPVKIAVLGVRLMQSTDLHIANGSSTFVHVDIGAVNTGAGMIHVNPNDFTLSTSSGHTVSHYSDTYSLNNYFDAVNLNQGQSTNGWIIFLLEKNDEYTLNYNGVDGQAQVPVIP